MNFRSSLRGLIGGGRGAPMIMHRHGPQQSATNMLEWIKRQRSLYKAELENEDVSNRIDRCIALEARQTLSRRARERDDAIFRAYYGENGIRIKLEEFVDFVGTDMDDEGDINKIFLIAYNGYLDMAAFQLRKLFKNLETLGDRPGELVTRENFERQIGWIDIEVRLKGWEKELTGILCAYKQGGADEAHLDKIAKHICVEMDEMIPSRWELMPDAKANFVRLAEHETYLNEACAYAPVNNELFGVLTEWLSDEHLKPLSVTEGINLEDYKKDLIGFADEIRRAILDRWMQL